MQCEIVTQSESGETPDYAGMTTENAPPDKGLLRIAQVAKRLSLSERITRQGIASGQLPIPVVTIGKVQFARAADVSAFLDRPFQPTRTPAQTSEDLF